MIKDSISVEKEIKDLVRRKWSHILALLINSINDIQLAEDSLQDAFESALHHWQKNGLPQNPMAWIITTARHKALDKIRRDKNLDTKVKQHQALLEIDINDNYLQRDVIQDLRLKLIFTCCHPALNENTSVALTLRLVGGLTTDEIAKAFLVKKETLAQRLVRGKRKIRKARIPFAIPQENLESRLKRVLKVIYLIFNEGYSASFGDKIIRNELCKEAIWLAKVLHLIFPKKPEVEGLLALMLLHDCRRPARLNKNGEFIPLKKQDRRLWIQEQLNEGLGLIKSALLRGSIGPYQLQASISAIYCEARKYSETNWHEIILIYEQMLKLNDSAVIRLNQTAALSNIESPESTLKRLSNLENRLSNYQPFYAFRANTLEKLNQNNLAKKDYVKAIELTHNVFEKNLLKSKVEALSKVELHLSLTKNST